MSNLYNQTKIKKSNKIFLKDLKTRNTILNLFIYYLTKKSVIIKKTKKEVKYMSLKKVSYSETNTTVNHSTGEITETNSKKVIRLPQEPAFVKLYLEDISRLHRLPATCSKIMIELVKRLDYDGTIALNGARKKQLMVHLGLKQNQAKPTQQIDNALSRMKKEGIIRSLDTGIYEFNPHYFAKGEWSGIHKRRENFELMTTYKSDGARVV